MGKGAILSGGDDGLYSVKMDRGKALKDKAIAECDKLIAALTANLAEYPPFITARENAIAQLQAALANAIAIYEFWVQIDPAGSNAKDAAKGVNNILADKLKSEGDLQALIARQNIVKGQLKAAQQRKAALQNVAAEVTQNIWCADYTLDKTGNINTIELPGEPSTVIVEPQSRPDDAPALLPSGDVVAREFMRSDHVYLNAAILPGWQAYKPTYRKGVIITTDTAADTATVGLLPAVSSAKDKYFRTLDINHRSPVTLTDVPVTYMTCNAAAFESGDSVVVQFDGQDWTKPRVIGFVERPKPCTVFVLALHGYFDDPLYGRLYRSMAVAITPSGNNLKSCIQSVETIPFRGAFSKDNYYWFEFSGEGTIEGDEYKRIKRIDTGLERPLTDRLFSISRNRTELAAIDFDTQSYAVVIDQASLAVKRRHQIISPSSGYLEKLDADGDYAIISGFVSSAYRVYCVNHKNGDILHTISYGSSDFISDVAISANRFAVLYWPGFGLPRLAVYSRITGSLIDDEDLPSGFDAVTMANDTVVVLEGYSVSLGKTGKLKIFDISSGIIDPVSEIQPLQTLIATYGLTFAQPAAGR